MGNCKAEQLTLYLVTDRKRAEEHGLAWQVEQAVLGGVTMVQFREKEIDEDTEEQLVGEVAAVCRKYGIPFIMNDSPEKTLRYHLDGVHVGQNDVGVREARELLGEKKIIGATAHNLEEALQAEREGADYLGVGAVFPSASKADTIPLSMEELARICNRVSIPVVAIGGLTYDNMDILQGSGVDGIAVISALSCAEDIREMAGKLKTKIHMMHMEKINAQEKRNTAKI